MPTLRIGHRKNVWFRDHAMWDTFTNVFSGCGGYSHSELIFPNGESFTSTTEFDPKTATYPEPATAIKRKGGPLLRRIGYPGFEWEYTDLDVADSKILQVREWCVKTIDDSIKDGGGYDWAGVMRFVMPWMKEHPKDWFCSESVVAALQTIGYFEGEKAWRISPNKLHKLCGGLNL